MAKSGDGELVCQLNETSQAGNSSECVIFLVQDHLCLCAGKQMTQKRTESPTLDTALPQMRSQLRLCSYLAGLQSPQQGVMQGGFVNIPVSFAEFSV